MVSQGEDLEEMLKLLKKFSEEEMAISLPKRKGKLKKYNPSVKENGSSNYKKKPKIEEGDNSEDMYDLMDCVDLEQDEQDEEDEDDDEELESPKTRRRSKKAPKPKYGKKYNPKYFDAQYVQQLAAESPDKYWRKQNGNPIDYIDQNYPLLLHKTLDHPGSIYCMKLSPDFSVLASASNLGTIRLWNVSNWSLIVELRDHKEENIEEFYTLCWSDDGRHILAAGKIKNRKKWCEEDEDNHICPCPIKVFNILTGEVVTKLEGHTEEILCVKKLKFKGINYLLSSSEDGRIIKWKMNENYSAVIARILIDDMTTYMAISLSFLPNCGNKYFLCACDDGIKLFDFELGKLVDSWKELYSYLCDCVKVVSCKDITTEEGEILILSKGVELLNEENPSEVMHPNKCMLHRLTMPSTPTGKWGFTEVARYQDDDYCSNLWLLQLSSNGIYVASPTTEGHIFLWNLFTKQLVTITKDHMAEPRKSLFHPTERMFLSCGDDSRVNIYTQKERTQPLVRADTVSSKGVLKTTENNSTTTPFGKKRAPTKTKGKTIDFERNHEVFEDSIDVL